MVLALMAYSIVIASGVGWFFAPLALQHEYGSTSQAPARVSAPQTPAPAPSIPPVDPGSEDSRGAI